jgi:hypothetical protein
MKDSNTLIYVLLEYLPQELKIHYGQKDSVLMLQIPITREAYLTQEILRDF